MIEAPSDWVVRFAALGPAGATLLDGAAGGGRHARFFAARGVRVTALDRDAAALGRLAGIAETIVADLENAAWPLDGRRFDAVVVTNYLWRPLFPVLEASVDVGGVLLYETFAVGQERFGRPANPDFLLRPGELPAAFAGLQTIASEARRLDAPPRCVQRLAARRERPAG